MTQSFLCARLPAPQVHRLLLKMSSSKHQSLPEEGTLSSEEFSSTSDRTDVATWMLCIKLLSTTLLLLVEGAVLVTSSRELHVSQQLVKVSVSGTPSDFNRLLSFLFELFSSWRFVSQLCVCLLSNFYLSIICYSGLCPSPASHNGKCLGVVVNVARTASHEPRRRVSKFSLTCISWAEHGLLGCKPMPIILL